MIAESMRPYLAMLRVRCSMLLQYRAAAFAGFITQLFWGFFKVCLFTSLFAYQLPKMQHPLTLSQTVGFIWMAQMLLGLLPWNVDREIEQQIRTGQVAYELLRPVNLYALWFTRSIAMRLIPTLLRSLPFVCLILVGVIEIPAPSGIGFVFFLAACFMALLLSAAITTLVSISLFWTISGQGIQRLLPHVSSLFSGLVIPLPFYPSWMQPALTLQPFRGIIDLPSRLYIGTLSPAEGPLVLLFQATWTVTLILVGVYAMRSRLRCCIIDGG